MGGKGREREREEEKEGKMEERGGKEDVSSKK